jgi:type II secretory pathway component GspD/PulD (secretin)
MRSRPVVVQDGSQATMLVEEEEPYTIRSTDNAGNTNFSVDFVQAEISLDISPHISSDNYLRLHIMQKVQSFGSRSSEDLPPPKTAREIETDIVVPDGHTVIMGGLIDQKEQQTDSGIPYLRDIPVLGYLFGASTDAKSSTSLFLFVTPHILRQGAHGEFDDYHRATWNRKLLADDLLQRRVDIPNASFRNPDDPDELDKLQDSGFLDMPRYKTPPRAKLSPEEATRRFEELRKHNKDTEGATK